MKGVVGAKCTTERSGFEELIVRCMLRAASILLEFSLPAYVTVVAVAVVAVDAVVVLGLVFPLPVFEACKFSIILYFIVLFAGFVKI